MSLLNLPPLGVKSRRRRGEESLAQILLSGDSCDSRMTDGVTQGNVSIRAVFKPACTSVKQRFALALSSHHLQGET